MPSNLSDRYAAYPRRDAYEDNSGHRSKKFDRPHTSNSAAPDTTLSIPSTNPPDNQTAWRRPSVSAVDALKNNEILFHGFRAVWVMALVVILSSSFERAWISVFVFERSDSACLVFRLAVLGSPLGCQSQRTRWSSISRKILSVTEVEFAHYLIPLLLINSSLCSTNFPVCVRMAKHSMKTGNVR